MSAGPLVLGVDASTSAVKVIAVDPEGRVHAEGRATFPLSNPEPAGWEQDARDWQRALVRATHDALAALDAVAHSSGGAVPDRAAIVALAIAHQRETFVLTDDHGAPLAPAIVWMDERAKPEVREVKAQADAARIHAISGKVPCLTPSLYKIRMQLGRLRPELAARSDLRLSDVHAFLTQWLTGEHATSLASADPLGLVAMERRAWDDELVALSHLPLRSLPTLFAPGSPIATLRPEAAGALGLDARVVVVAGAGDGQAAGLGAGVVEAGHAYLNVGTAVVAGVPSPHYRVSRGFRTLYAADGEGYLLETDLKGGTLTFDWLADRLLGRGAIEGGEERTRTLAALEAKAASLPPGANGLMALPYWAGVMSPHWDDDAGGALIGLRADHGPEHLYRAICEGLAFEQRLAFEAVEADAGPIARVSVMGGATRRDAFLRVFGSALGRPVERASSDETTAYGAAMLAAAHAGVAASAKEVAAKWVDGAPRPFADVDTEPYERLYREAYRGLYEGMAGALRVLAEKR